MAAAVSSPRGTSPNVAAPPVTVENAVKSTSAGTTVRTEEHAPHHAQVHTRRHSCHCGQGSAHLSLQLHQQRYLFQVLLPVAVRLASLGPDVNSRLVITTARMRAPALSARATSQPVVVQKASWVTSASTVSLIPCQDSVFSKMFSCFYLLVSTKALLMNETYFIKWNNCWKSICAGQCDDFCKNEGLCMEMMNGTKHCRCNESHFGPQCEMNKCEYCGTGKCEVLRTGITCKYVPAYSAEWAFIMYLH